jgi:hypothetical protein
MVIDPYLYKLYEGRYNNNLVIIISHINYLI